MQGFEIKFNIYADSQQEADEARNAIVGFIAQNARFGRAVTGRKIADIVGKWESNPIVRNAIIKYFS
jgi:hypothetical protein